MQAEFLDSIHKIPASEWNSIVPAGQIIRTHEYLLAMEHSGMNECEYGYLLLRDQGLIVAHTSFYRMNTTPDFFATGLLKEAVQWVRSFWPGFLVLPSLECGSPLALGHTLSVRDGYDVEAAASQMIQELELFGARQGTGILAFRDFEQHDEALGRVFVQAGYRRMPNLPCAFLDVAWQSFDGYLASMRSEYRYKAQRRRRRFRDGGGGMVRIKDFGPYCAIMAGLWEQTYRRAKEYRREFLREGYFLNMSHYLGDRASILLATVGEHPVGFALLLRDHDVLRWLVGGLDYDFNTRLDVYYNLLYSIVETGMEMGVRSIDFGITTLAPKLDIGCRAVPLYIYLKHLHPALHRILPRIFTMITPCGMPEPRAVFKGGVA